MSGKYVVVSQEEVNQRIADHKQMVDEVLNDPKLVEDIKLVLRAANIEYWDWISAGLYYGYPHCCIKAFPNIGGEGRKHPIMALGAGYIPCDACGLKTTEAIIEDINSRRIHGVPFPEVL